MRQETATSQNVVGSSLALHLTTSVVPDQPSLQLDLPDPESDDISTMEFLARLEQAWAICDRFDLQTEIWRGRILGAVRDREKRGGEGRGAGFLQWLRENEISKTRAYGLIQLAEAADAMLTEGALEESSVNQFSKRAFMETAQAVPEVQLMISEAANEGQEITRKQVRRLTDEFTAATSPLLPEEIRQRTQENLLPPRAVAPLVRELAKLPEPQQEDFRKVLRDEPELDRIKDVTSTRTGDIFNAIQLGFIPQHLAKILLLRFRQLGKLPNKGRHSSRREKILLGALTNFLRQQRTCRRSEFIGQATNLLPRDLLTFISRLRDHQLNFRNRLGRFHEGAFRKLIHAAFL